MYYSYIHYRSKAEEIISFIKSNSGSSVFLDYSYGLELTAYLVWMSYKSRNDKSNLKPYIDIIDNPNSDIEERTKAQKIYNIIISFDKTSHSRYPERVLNIIEKKIEMLEQFVGND